MIFSLNFVVYSYIYNHILHCVYHNNCEGGCSSLLKINVLSACNYKAASMLG